MKKSKFVLSTLLAFTMAVTSCDNLDIIDNENSNNQEQPSEDGVYPQNAIVWKEGSTITLKKHFLVAKDSALYIEPGVTIIADNEDLKPEVVVLGNLYAMGTQEKPILFTVPDKHKADRFSRMWGGIICGYDSKEVLLSNTIIEYSGAQTSEESLSFQYKLFKTNTGEGVPAFHFCNVDGKFVITDCIFRDNAEDHIYITGGNSIVYNNLFFSNGYDGGEAINYKSGCKADIAYNTIYDANTNGFKLSNSGLSVDIPSSHLVIYNNTILNTGWRRPKVKGGSIWLEANIRAELYNNLVADCRWGLKHSTDEGENPNSVLTPNYYFASTEAGVQQMQPNESEGIIKGANDVMSDLAGDKDPLFVNFVQQSNININAGSDLSNAPMTYNTEWDFHLKESSPALSGGVTNFNRLFADNAITFDGLKSVDKELKTTYNSPAPASYFGAFGTK